MLTREAARQLYARLFISMSESEAKDLLGFPPSSNPSDSEVNKALRVLVPKFHPDRGGDPRMMVELNVAADILKGKRQPDNDPAYRDPEEEKQRQEQMQRRKDLDAILSARKQAVDAMGRAIQSVSSIKQAWHLNLRNYLTREVAENLDAFQSLTDKALQDRAMDPKYKAIWQRFDKGLHDIGGRTLRTANRVTKLWMGFQQIRKSDGVSMKDLDATWDDVVEFQKSFHDYREEFGKLISTVSSADTDPIIPTATYDKVVEPVHDSYLMVASFDDDFQKTRRHDEGKGLEKAVEVVKEVLKSRGIKAGADWKDWKVPADFDKAVGQVDSTRSAAERVAKRFTAPERIARRVIARFNEPR